MRAYCVRLVLAHPEQLRRSESGKRSVAGEPQQLFEPAPGFHLGTLGRRALVVPEDRRSDHGTGFVQADKSVHLTREADAEDLSDGRLQAREHLVGGAEPILRPLLHPAGVR